MRPNEARVVARYHREQLATGFLGSLGNRVLTHLYVAIARSRYGFVHVALDRTGQVVGFVSGSTDVKKLYRSVLLRRGWAMAGAALPRLFRRGMIRRVIESLRYPQRVDASLPRAEGLSIVVDCRYRGSGLADDLLRALANEFRRRGVLRFKILVGAELARAYACYRRNGFRQVGTMTSHGQAANVLIRDID